VWQDTPPPSSGHNTPSQNGNIWSGFNPSTNPDVKNIHHNSMEWPIDRSRRTNASLSSLQSRILDNRSTSVPLPFGINSTNVNNTSKQWEEPTSNHQIDLPQEGMSVPQPFRSVSLPTIPYGTDFLNSSIWSNGYFGKGTSHSVKNPSLPFSTSSPPFNNAGRTTNNGTFGGYSTYPPKSYAPSLVPTHASQDRVWGSASHISRGSNKVYQNGW